ncbi:Solute carrier family 12 member 5 [Armadillidium nasatum]|uniref:Solute carrier family 12 member 5 n=1 Tax=Armadillidium nasatum TaxID=96803 RepID=A0A5N5TE81_9CRUS|nr:Solute carrier family 12 member 5 [Armadillidium nasatum]
MPFKETKIDGNISPPGKFSKKREDSVNSNSGKDNGARRQSSFSKSLRQYLTRERLPREENYRDIQSIVDGQGRPSLQELHNDTHHQNTFPDMCKGYFGVIDIIPGAGGGLNDVRILGTLLLLFVLFLGIVGMDWITRDPYTMSKEPKDSLVPHVFSENAKTDYRYYEGEQNFFTVFGVFFSAVTGIFAGANFSGDLKVMELVSIWGPLIYAGTYAATLSSAISCLTGAPRILQALGKDRLYPYMEFFEVGWGSNNDPVRGYVLVFLISFACIMFELNWGSTLHGQSYLIALRSSLDLVKVPENVKNYRPQILVLSGNPCFRPPLVHFANSITDGASFLACANIVEGRLSHKTRQATINRTYKWFDSNKVRSFYTLVSSKNIEEGSRYLFQFVGLGNLRPNMVLLGFKSDWRDCDKEDLRSYFNTLHEAFNFYLGIAILRVPNGLDFSNVLADETKPPQIRKSADTNIQITPPSPKDVTSNTDGLANGPNITNKHKEDVLDDDYDDDEKLEVEKEEFEVEQELEQDVIIIPDVTKKAEKKSRDEFEEMISKFRTNEEDGDKEGLWITDEELLTRREKTNRHLRIRELLLEHSKDASLIVIKVPGENIKLSNESIRITFRQLLLKGNYFKLRKRRYLRFEMKDILI